MEQSQKDCETGGSQSEGVSDGAGELVKQKLEEKDHGQLSASKLRLLASF